MSQPAIAPLDTASPLDLETVGGKGLSLAGMTAAGFNVPRGFCLTTDAYRQYVAAGGLQEKIIELARPELVDGAVSFEAASLAIQSLFTAALPDAISEAVLAAFAKLDVSQGVAVRSSATAEDLPDLSFAGQQDTYLNVRGEDQLLTAVRNCWASLWTERAIGYRHEVGVAQDAVAMAVVVQQMVPSDVSGILFTANPATGERSEMIINASFGLGEAVVGGEITPDTYIVDRARLTVKDTIIGGKEHMIVAGEQGTDTQAVSEKERAESSLTEDQIKELAALAARVEKHYDGLPQDIEWAMTFSARGNSLGYAPRRSTAEGARSLFLLQSRPITNLPPPPITDAMWEVPEDMPDYKQALVRRKLSEHIPDPISPLFEDVYLMRALNDANIRFMDGLEYDISEFVGHYTINGYVYMAAGRPPIDKRYEAWVKAARDKDFDGPVPPKRTEAARRDLAYHRRAERWENERVPEYLATIDKWHKVDLATAGNAQLLRGIDELAAADSTYWFEGFLEVMAIVRNTDSQFQAFLETHGGDAGFTSGMFLTGMKSVAMEAEEQMWAIVQSIRNHDTIAQLVLVTPAARLLPVLRQTAEASEVVAAIDVYLKKYGHEVSTLDFCEPTSGEDPTTVMLNLKALVGNVDYDPAERERDLSCKREQALARAGEFFRGEAEQTDRAGNVKHIDLNDEFNRLLEDAKRYYHLREAGLYYLAAGWPVLRSLALELGRRLVAVGSLESAGHVFFLEEVQLHAALEAQAGGGAVPEMAKTAVGALQLREARKRLRPWPQIPMPELEDSQVEGQGMGGMRIRGGWALGSVQMVNPEGDTLEGYACSPGQVTGPASVILSPADFHEMQPNSILVCPMTTPAWTHLFSQATGLVTDVGGILSHGSIVAREYNIPAVLGTGDITDRVQSGQQISVDGTAGVVTIVGGDGDDN